MFKSFSRIAYRADCIEPDYCCQHRPRAKRAEEGIAETQRKKKFIRYKRCEKELDDIDRKIELFQ